jgi:hypothetical protein
MSKNLIYFFCGMSLIVTSNAIATPNTVEVGISCPNGSGSGYNSLSNFGRKIHGYGKESINSIPGSHAPYFSYHFTSGHFPANIANGSYTNTGVDYDPTSGAIICKFTSANGYDPINVVYHMKNGKGGVVLSQTQDEIVFLQYIGLKA